MFDILNSYWNKHEFALECLKKVQHGIDILEEKNRAFTRILYGEKTDFFSNLSAQLKKFKTKDTFNNNILKTGIYINPYEEYKINKPITAQPEVKKEIKEEDEPTVEFSSPLYFDIDNSRSFEFARTDAKELVKILSAVFNIPLNEIRIFFSGNKGFHIMVDNHLFGSPKRSDMNQFNRFLFTSLNLLLPYESLDTKIYDTRRVLRMTNTVNLKSGYYKIEITAKELFTLSRERILEMAQFMRCSLRKHKMECIEKAKETFNKLVDAFLESENKVILGSRTRKEMDKLCHIESVVNYKFCRKLYLAPCIESMRQTKVFEGNRHMFLLILGSSFAQDKRYDSHNTITYKQLEENVKDYIMAYNYQNCSPNLLEPEIENITIGALNYAYGCSGIHNLGFCDKEKREKCKVWRTKQKQQLDREEKERQLSNNKDSPK